MDYKDVLRNLKQDKLLHFIAGILSVDFLFVICNIFFSFWISLLISFAISTIIMAGKEIIYDKLIGKGVCNIKDFIYGFVAIII